MNTHQSNRVSASRHYAFFDDGTALQLTQAFNAETELTQLLNLLVNQLTTLCDARGMRYVHKQHGIDLMLRDKDRHTAEYNLIFREFELGTLTLYFNHRQSEQDIQTCEDLLSLAMSALRNCICLLDVRAPLSVAAELNAEEQHALHQNEQTLRTQGIIGDAKSDALMLISLDEFNAIKERDGEEWAHILMASVHEQINNGLRAADGVFHIGDDLLAVLLPNTTVKQAEEVAQKVRALVAALELQGTADSTKDHSQLTASIGICAALNESSADSVMRHAKQALERAQSKGGNEICFHID
jgi:diguanylate cyclase (GGDEF)-like protein